VPSKTTVVHFPSVVTACLIAYCVEVQVEKAVQVPAISVAALTAGNSVVEAIQVRQRSVTSLSVAGKASMAVAVETKPFL